MTAPPPRPALVAVLCVALGLVGSAPAAAQAGDAAERRAYVEGRFVRALTLHAVGDEGAAAAALDEVLELRPDAAAVYDARADVALARGETTDALFYAERAAALAPASGHVRLRLAQAYARAGRPAEAAAAAEAARDLSPGDPAVWGTLADLYDALGRDADERAALAAWTRLRDTPEARLRLSALAEAAGDPDEAREQARAARRLAPSDPPVLRRLAALDRPAPPRPNAGAGADRRPESPGGVGALLALVEADPRRLDVWAQVLEALAASADPRAGAVADDALLLFPAVPSVAAPAAEAYLAAGRPADARRAAERALATLGDGDAAVRARLDAVLDATD